MLMLKKHWPGILAAVAVAFLVVLPNLAFTLSPEYKGMPPMYTDAESLYLSRIHAVYRGCIMSCNPYIKEYGSLYPSFDPSISEAVVALPGIIFGISVVHLQYFYLVFFPFVLALLAYALAYRLTKRRGISVVATLFIFLGYNLVNVRDLVNLIDLKNLFLFKASPDFLPTYARPVNPPFSSIVFLAYLHALLSFMQSSKKKWMIVLTGLYAFSFYTYFYLYGFLSAINVAALVVFLVQKDFIRFRQLLGITIVGLIVAIPIMRELFALIHHPYYSSIPIVPHLHPTHMPIVSVSGILALTLIALVTIILIKRYKEVRPEFFLLLILALASFGVLNEHVLTGIKVEGFHFEWYYITPAFVLGITYLLSRSAKHIAVWLIVFLALLPIVNAVLIDRQTYKDFYPTAVRDQMYMPVLIWLQQNVPKGSVVYANDTGISNRIPVFTDSFVFWSSFAVGFLHPAERLRDVVNARSSEDAFLSIIKKYDLHYFVVSKENAESAWVLPGATKLYSDSNYTVYKY